MSPAYRLITGNCIDVLAGAKAESIDSLVTDAPYALSFMGLDFDKPAEMLGTAIGLSGGFQKFPPGVKRPEIKRNDPVMFQEWCRMWGVEALRVMKPGAYGVCFGATRTYHRLAAGLEDAGFEIRDTLMYLHGQGMPKGLNASKAIDKHLGAERSEGGRVWTGGQRSGGIMGDNLGTQSRIIHDTPVTDEARQWDGFNTQLKPAVEPIVLFQKPFKGTIANNVLEHGVGALNIDACRIGTSGSRNNGRQADSLIYGAMGTSEKVDYDRGRHPANVILGHHDYCRPTCEFVQIKGDQRGADETKGKRNGGFLDVGADCGDASPNARVYGDDLVEVWDCHIDCPVSILDAQSGVMKGGSHPGRRGSDGESVERTAYGYFSGQEGLQARRTSGGGASRFFYKAKPSKSEKLAGVPEDLSKRMHETTKGIDLMRYLARLVTPPQGTILDCFLGSGTTGCAAMLEGFKFVGIEQSPEYMLIAEARMEHWNAVAEAGDA